MTGRRQQHPHQRLYDLREWRDGLRPAQLRRQPLCALCADLGRDTIAEHVDHIEPHRGDHALFRDPANLRSLCPSCHSRVTHTTRRVIAGAGADGLPADPRHPWRAEKDN